MWIASCDHFLLVLWNRWENGWTLSRKPHSLPHCRLPAEAVSKLRVGDLVRGRFVFMFGFYFFNPGVSVLNAELKLLINSSFADSGWLNVCMASDVEIVTSSVMVVGDGALGGDWIIDPPEWDQCLMKHTPESSLVLSTMWGHLRKRHLQPRRGPSQNPTCCHPDLWTSSLQNCEKQISG